MEKWLPVAVPGDFLSLSQPGPSQINRCHPKTMTPLSWSCFTPPDPSSLKTCLEEVETSRFSTATFSLGQLFLPGALSLKLIGTIKLLPRLWGEQLQRSPSAPRFPSASIRMGKLRELGEKSFLSSPVHQRPAQKLPLSHRSPQPPPWLQGPCAPHTKHFVRVQGHPAQSEQGEATAVQTSGSAASLGPLSVRAATEGEQPQPRPIPPEGQLQFLSRGAAAKPWFSK